MKEEPRDIATQRIRLMDGLRAFGGTYNEFGRRFAAWLGVHSTDAVALVEIFYAEERGAPLSPPGSASASRSHRAPRPPC
ncbi:hypothetical protein ACFQHO_15570 [Actinomadura yumaensis]|uniref:hypothetical protein n=1 Tax=Actinomadura yumaensis TaxID=111807 RepID=UPI00360D053A